MKHRPNYVIPCLRHRPVMNGHTNRMASDQETLKIPRSSRPLVGFAPSIVANHRQIHGAIRKLGFSILVDSFWECRSRSMTAGQKETNIYRLSAADGEWSTAVSTHLANLRRQFFEAASLTLSREDCYKWRCRYNA